MSLELTGTAGGMASGAEPRASRDSVVARQAWSRQVAADLVAIGDAVAVAAGAAFPAVIYHSQAGGVVENGFLLAQSAIAGAIITFLCLRSWNMYDTSRMHDFPKATGRLIAALLIGILCVNGLGMPYAIRDTHMFVWFFAWAAASNVLLLLNRNIAHAVLKRLTAHGYFHERVAVFGAGEIARRVKRLLENQELSIHFAGVFDDRAGEARIDSLNLDIRGRLDDLLVAARNEEFDQIIIALPQGAEERISAVVKRLEQVPASVHIVTHISSDLTGGAWAHKVSNLGPIGLLDVKRKPLADWAHFVKRLEDAVLGTIFVLAFLPLFPLIAAAIKLDSPGPVFFRQRRRGLNHRVFEVLKFRTMYVMEDGPDVRQATAGDDRVTRIGRFLRRTSLDELPQLINVLKGDMSLVGPRPHALVHDEQFGEMLETYANRHQMKPGITGLAQVLGHRGEIASACNIEARVNADLDYIRNWSLGLDLKILAQTLSAIVSGRNAH